MLCNLESHSLLLRKPGTSPALLPAGERWVTLGVLSSPRQLTNQAEKHSPSPPDAKLSPAKGKATIGLQTGAAVGVSPRKAANTHTYCRGNFWPAPGHNRSCPSLSASTRAPSQSWLCPHMRRRPCEGSGIFSEHRKAAASFQSGPSCRNQL